MSKIIKRITLVFVLVFVSSAAISQSNKKLEDMGDQAMIKGKYASSVYFYSQVLNRLIGNPDLYYNAYEVIAFYKAPKKGRSSFTLSNRKQRRDARRRCGLYVVQLLLAM